MPAASSDYKWEVMKMWNILGKQRSNQKRDGDNEWDPQEEDQEAQLFLISRYASLISHFMIFSIRKDNNGAQGRQVLKKSPCCRRSSGLSGFPTVEDWLPSSPVLSWEQPSYKKDGYYKLELQQTSTLVVSSEKGVFSSIFSAVSVDRNLCPGMKSTPVTSLNTVLSSS